MFDAVATRSYHDLEFRSNSDVAALEKLAAVIKGHRRARPRRHDLAVINAPVRRSPAEASSLVEQRYARAGEQTRQRRGGDRSRDASSDYCDLWFLHDLWFHRFDEQLQFMSPVRGGFRRKAIVPPLPKSSSAVAHVL